MLRYIIRYTFSFIPLFAAVYTLVVLVLVALYIYFFDHEKKINRVGISEIIAMGYGAWGLMIFWMYYVIRMKW